MDTSGQIELKIEKERLRLAYENLRNTFITVPMAVIVIVLVELWDAPDPHPAQLIFWGALILASLLPRYYYYHNFLKEDGKAVVDYGLWARKFWLGAIMGGVVWGATPLILFPGNSTEHRIFITLVIGGMAAGASFTYAPLLRPTQYFMTLTLVPLVFAHIHVGGSVSYGIAFMTSLFYLMLMVTLKNNNRIIYESIRLALENTERKIYENKLEVANEELKVALEQVRQTQAGLMRSEKLAAVGTLSAGVVHEILNPLNTISTICQLLLLDERRGRVFESLNEILLQIQRATKITNGLRMFAREKKMDITAVSLPGLFDHTVKLMEHDLNLDNIFIKRQFDPDTPPIMADADQLAQVFMNLLTNARDALQPRRGGTITVVTKAIRNGVEFRFGDNGPGMPQHVIERIFDPFFTTKDPGKGTGLGLSITHRIIEDHGGTITMESREGEGTKFTIFLPKDGASRRAMAKKMDTP